MIDSKGRIFGKLNIVDIFIVAAIIAGLVWFFGIRDTGGTVEISVVEETFILTFATHAHPDFSVNAVNMGDIAEDFLRGGQLGTVTRLVTGQGTDLRASRYGEFVRSPLDGFLSIEFDVETRGHRSENGIIINGNQYLIGQNITMSVGMGRLFIMLRSIEPKGGL